MHAMMHLVWSAIPLFSADRTRAVPIGASERTLAGAATPPLFAICPIRVFAYSAAVDDPRLSTPQGTNLREGVWSPRFFVWFAV